MLKLKNNLLLILGLFSGIAHASAPFVYLDTSDLFYAGLDKKSWELCTTQIYMENYVFRVPTALLSVLAKYDQLTLNKINDASNFLLFLMAWQTCNPSFIISIIEISDKEILQKKPKKPVAKLHIMQVAGEEYEGYFIRTQEQNDYFICDFLANHASKFKSIYPIKFYETLNKIVEHAGICDVVAANLINYHMLKKQNL